MFSKLTDGHPPAVIRKFAGRLLGWMRFWWFDFSRGIETRQIVDLKPSETNANHTRYEPTPPARVRTAIAALNLSELSRYTFIDLGSGKGRVLIVAAEHPFQEVVGIEFDSGLHEICVRNLDRCRGRFRAPVRALLGDAAEFPLPDGPCVFFSFFPFRQPLMKRVVHRIVAEFQARPRDLFFIQVGEWEWVPELMRREGFRLVSKHDYVSIYRFPDGRAQADA